MNRLSILGFFLLAGSGLAAAQVPEVRLSRPAARYPHELSSITGLLELPDGRVLVSDGIDETLLRIDLRTLKTDTVGRTGSGPGEYKGPDLLFAQPGNGVLLVDLGNARLSFYDAALKYRESAPIARGQPGAGMTMALPSGVDALGRLYFRPGGMNPKADSGAILRWDRTRDRTDTVATVKLGEMTVRTSGSANNRSVMSRSVPLSPEDVWSVAPDGRIVIVRAADYRVEWLTPGGGVVRGPANPWKPVPVRDADKREYAADMRLSGVSMSVTSQNGQVSIRMGRGRPTGAQEEEEIPDLDWPATKPAARSVRVSPAGDAWVERWVAAGSPRAFDVFGADGKLKQRVILPAGRSLIGFGKGAVYLRERTEDDLVYLERYALTD